MSQEIPKQDPAPPEPASPPEAAPPAAPPVDEEKAARDAAFAEQRRRAEAAEKQLKDLQEREAQREREKAEEEGRWKDLAEQADAARKAAEAEAARVKSESAIKEIAAQMDFRNPSDALALLPTDVDRTDDEQVKAALQALAEDRAYLIKTEPAHTPAPPSGNPAGGTPPAASHRPTFAEIKNMTPAQIGALDQTVVNEVLAAGP